MLCKECKKLILKRIKYLKKLEKDQKSIRRQRTISQLEFLLNPLCWEYTK